MTRVDVSRFVTLALNDKDVRQKLESDPEQAFQGFDLTSEEKDAIKTANEQALRDIGLDPMTARSWMAFHDVGEFAPDRPDAQGDVPSEGS